MQKNLLITSLILPFLSNAFAHDTPKLSCVPKTCTNPPRLPGYHPIVNRCRLDLPTHLKPLVSCVDKDGIGATCICPAGYYSATVLGRFVKCLKGNVYPYGEDFEDLKSDGWVEIRQDELYFKRLSGKRTMTQALIACREEKFGSKLMSLHDNTEFTKLMQSITPSFWAAYNLARAPNKRTDYIFPSSGLSVLDSWILPGEGTSGSERGLYYFTNLGFGDHSHTKEPVCELRKPKYSIGDEKILDNLLSDWTKVDVDNMPLPEDSSASGIFRPSLLYYKAILDPLNANGYNYLDAIRACKAINSDIGTEAQVAQVLDEHELSAIKNIKDLQDDLSTINFKLFHLGAYRFDNRYTWMGEGLEVNATLFSDGYPKPARGNVVLDLEDNDGLVTKRHDYDIGNKPVSVICEVRIL